MAYDLSGLKIQPQSATNSVGPTDTNQYSPLQNSTSKDIQDKIDKITNTTPIPTKNIFDFTPVGNQITPLAHLNPTMPEPVKDHSAQMAEAPEYTPAREIQPWEGPERDPIQAFLNDTKDNPEYASRRNAVIQMLKDGLDTGEIGSIIMQNMSPSGASVKKEEKPTGWDAVNIPSYKPYGEGEFKPLDSFENFSENTNKFMANAIWGAINIAGGIGNSVLHPINTTKSVYSLGDGLTDIAAGQGDTENAIKAKDAFNEIVVKKYWSWDGFTKAMKENPTEIVADLLTVVSGGASLAGKVSELQKASTLSNLRKASVTGELSAAERAWLIDKAQTQGQFAETAEKVGDTANKYNPYIAIPKLWTAAIAGTAGKIADVTGNVSKKTSEMYDRTVANIDPSKTAGYQSNPYQKQYFEDMTKQAESPEGIQDIKAVQESHYDDISDEVQKNVESKQESMSENWPVYQAIRDLPVEIDSTQVIPKMEAAIRKGGLEIVDGQVVKSPSIKTTVISPSDITKINNIYQGLLADAEKSGGKFSASDMLDSRKNVDSLINYDRLASTDKGQSILRDIRGGIDTIAKDQIPWLREIDKNFVDKLAEYKDATRDLIYKAGDTKGDFRSNINAIISNLNTPNRATLLARLEEDIPWIGQKVQAVRNLGELYKSYTSSNIKWKFVNPVTGATAGAAIWYTQGGVIGAGLWALAGFVLWGTGESILNKLKTNRLNSILGKTSEKWLDNLRDINQRIRNNEALKVKDKRVIDNLRKEVYEAQKNGPKVPIPKKSRTLQIGAPTGKPLMNSQTVGKTGEAISNLKPINLPKPWVLSKDSRAFSEKSWEKPWTSKQKVKEMPEWQKLLPAPRLPRWTDFPRTDVSAQSMREQMNTLSKSEIKEKVKRKPIQIPDRSPTGEILPKMPSKSQKGKGLSGLKIKKE